jgi:hypothetical protein
VQQLENAKKGQGHPPGGYSRQLLVNPNGQAAVQETWSSTINPQNGGQIGVVGGVGGGFGPQVSWSSEQNLQNFAGPGQDFNVAYAQGPGGAVDISVGNGGVIQYNASVVGGAGGWGGAALYTKSTVTPVCPPE